MLCRCGLSSLFVAPIDECFIFCWLWICLWVSICHHFVFKLMFRQVCFWSDEMFYRVSCGLGAYTKKWWWFTPSHLEWIWYNDFCIIDVRDFFVECWKDIAEIPGVCLIYHHPLETVFDIKFAEFEQLIWIVIFSNVCISLFMQFLESMLLLFLVVIVVLLPDVEVVVFLI